MNMESRLKGLELWLLGVEEIPEEVKFRAAQNNAWFTYENIDKAFLSIQSLVKSIREEEVCSKYDLSKGGKRIGLILAGNIPFVGFHDILSVLLTGNIAVIKPSSQDLVLLDFLIKKLKESGSDFVNSIEMVSKLELDKLDAIIATGSDNTARYFETYFAKVPNVIRKSRTSVAILTGKESTVDLKKLGEDVFTYFGLGCRNVSKIFIPKEYDLTVLLDAWEEFDPIMDLSKYANNYTYYKSAFLVNSTKHLDTGYVLVTESKDLSSPLGVLYFEKYDSKEELKERLAENVEGIQCVVGDGNIDFGSTQNPKFLDYADGVDTLAFLTSL
jgi:hypothetical protein